MKYGCSDCMKAKDCPEAGQCAYCNEFVDKDAEKRPEPDPWED